MEIDDLLYFEKHEATHLYLAVVNESGAVFYCEADEKEQPCGDWKLVNMDINAMSHLH